MTISTTANTPSHGHTIAKNLLDLLARPQKGLRTARRGLLYYDDRQIHGLSLSCHHGLSEPSIWIEAMSLRDFLDDLELATHVGEGCDGRQREFEENDVDSFRDTLRNKDGLREMLSEAAYDSLVHMDRQKAQMYLLGGSQIRLAHLGYLFRLGLRASTIRYGTSYTTAGTQC